VTSLEGRAALVTGASTGIGAAAAVALAEAGADVGINYRRSKRAAQGVRRRIERLGRRAMLLECDVCDPDQVDAMVEAFADEFGRLDILFANAGGLVQRSPIASAPDRLWHQVIALNLDSVFYTVRAALGPMLKARCGSIIVNASLAARTGGGGGSVPYAAAKGALVSFTKGLALEVAADGIRVNAVAPGVTLTPFHDKVTEPARMKQFKASIPIGRCGEAADIARAVVWLAGETDGFITGETIYLAGGA
jgi:3-oxoacyl-[acyl-carrier protein] reductase